jgi:lysophospholipase L1-like esterase
MPSGGPLTELPSAAVDADRSTSTIRRDPSIEPYLRGAAWPATGSTAYPRADLTDARLPLDTRACATVPVGVRLELTGDATHLDVGYTTTPADLGHRGAAAGVTFSVWRCATQVDEQPAEIGAGVVRLRLGPATGRAIVYLPEGLTPVITGLAAVGGTIEPAPSQPRWIAYGDSIAEGWVSSGPAHSWPAVTARRLGLDVVNMGYAGSGRGEIASAEHLAALPADIVTISHGTNCWSRVPHSATLMRAATEAFVRLVRGGHPGVPIVVCSPVIRPDAEDTPNALGATLGELRRAMEDAVGATGDDLVVLVPGRDLLSPEMLPDGVHPGDLGHQVLAEVIGAAMRSAFDRVR